jgi:polar amino acid transport system permease protein
MNYVFHFGQITRYIPFLLGGAGVSLALAFLAFCGGMVLGLFGAIAHSFGGPLLRRLCRFYVVFFTNTPQLVQIYFIFFVLPDAGVVLSPFQAVLIGMTINAGAYLTEIQRAGFASIRHEEIEAAETLNMTLWQEVRFVILPHVVRTLYAPLSSHYILMVLGTSMAAVFGVEELTGRAYSVNAMTFRSVEIFSVTGVMYIVVTILASSVLAIIGRSLFRARMNVI